MGNKLEELLGAIKLGELLHKKENAVEEKKNTLVWILAILGAVAAVAGIAYAVYRYCTPDYLDDFDDFDDFDDYDDDFDDFNEETTNEGEDQIINESSNE